ncbi:putative M18 family aminopeptidase 2 [Clostridia bacterium]|nr:putative M18 family aminopeptidase 2 [Clostridia bacterium]
MYKLLDLVKNGVSPFHTVKRIREQLEKAGFLLFDFSQSNKKEQGYFIDLGSALFAFKVNQNWGKKEDSQQNHSVRIAAAHTDSPCFRLKPKAKIKNGKYLQANVEVYGGVIRSTWMDRPLSLAGRVSCKGQNAWQPQSYLFHPDKTLLTIPNLAIHLNPKANQGLEIHPQKELIPIYSTIEEQMKEIEISAIIAKELKKKEEEILDYELYVYNHEEAEIWGINQEFISGPRLDNLTSVQACISGLLDAKREDGLDMVALFDHEEIGSRTKQGANSAVLGNLLERIFEHFGLTRKDFLQAIAGNESFLLSVDTAHATHPNYGEKYDPTNPVYLNSGFACKLSSRQSYATDSMAIAIIESLCREKGISYQKYVNHSDIAGGGTLGVLASANLAMQAADIGLPMLAMHSARETIGAKDVLALTQFLTEFFS